MTQTHEEIYDLVDENDQIIGQVVRSEANSRTDRIHREVAILIYDDQNQILLQKRSKNKKVGPGYWTVATEGHIDRGDSPENAAHRELQEEMNFDTQLKFWGKELIHLPNETHFTYWFTGKYTGQQITVDTNEVETYRFVSQSEFDQFSKQNKVGDYTIKRLNKFWMKHKAFTNMPTCASNNFQITTPQDVFIKICDYFQLGTFHSAELIDSGIANQNFVLKTSKNTFILRRLVEQNPKFIENDVSIELQLARKNIKAPKLVKSKVGSNIFHQDVDSYITYPMIKGITPKITSKTLCRNLGMTLAKFHLTVTHLPLKHKGWLNLQNNKHVNDKSKIAIKSAKLKNLTKIINVRSLPKGIIHGDFHEDNVLIDNPQTNKIVAILDFEEADENIFLIDIARSLLSSCKKTDTQLDQSLVNSWLKGYSSIRKLTQVELENLDKAINLAAGLMADFFIKNDLSKFASQFIKRAQTYGH